MNKAITQGLALMPPPFSSGLSLWSREDGRSGQNSYQGQPNAALVPSDQDFGSCLELQKTTATQKLRCFANIPLQPGLYLQVTARVKAISGALPSVRIAGWAEASNGTNVTSAVQTGPAVALTGYGQVMTVRAIIASSNRMGVDMPWGTAPVLGHFGLDLTGPNGGVVRIDDITIEDVTGIFHGEMFDWVDVRDFGAIGNGIVNDAPAFEAADSAAAGRTVVVSPGTYNLATHVTFDNPVSFQGTVVMPASQRLICMRNYDLETYTAAFGSEAEGFRRALQALFYFTDHVELDMKGRKVDLSGPLNVASLAGITNFTQRRVLKNGQIVATANTAWDGAQITTTGTYSTAFSARLTGVANAGTIPVGSLVTGTGVGREVYVTSVDAGTGTVFLSADLVGGNGTRSYTFTEIRHMLDFSGFTQLSRFEIRGIEFLCQGNASCISLPLSGSVNLIADCTINRPRRKGVTSISRGCQDLTIDNCHFMSNETALPAQNRVTVAFNVNANDAKIRNNRAMRFAHFAVMGGAGHLILGNHFFGGDDEVNGLRRAGLVFTGINLRSFLTGNYIDNHFIELSNEHDDEPDFASEYTFGGLSMTGNCFTSLNSGPGFRWIVITPRGPGHSIANLVVTSNVFRATDGTLDRPEAVDTSYATLQTNSFRNVIFSDNTFNGVTQHCQSPIMIEHSQNTAADTWVIEAAPVLPFGGRARNVTSVVPKASLTTAANAVAFPGLYTLVEQGAGNTQAHLKWSAPVKGKALVTIRVDNPL